MFTTFLIALAATVSAVMGGMLLRPRPDVAPLQVPYRAVGVGSAAAALVALGFWLI